ncbi:glutamate transport system permease protein [Microbacterium proteolyticum]|uniref:Glutamate transport system permease protein n=1 Tax=Microbacterium proteolyticum TaxID=1572644 RepID=A0A7W5CF50_9MICO|nr:amino acid ABC transporter permease [Microbacterium proteolyticum]MBB3156487.1 glutamate transport system permease protein [Microbacterium proteolyticum]
MSSSVLYDVPGPRARVRNRILGAATLAVVAAIIGFVVWRFIDTGQFSAAKWNVFSYSAIWERFGQATLATLAAFAVAAVGALVLGFILAIGRLSDHRWVRLPVGWAVELLRAVPVLVFMLLLYYGLPVIGIRMSSYWAVVIALVLYNGSVLSEVIRAGVEALPRGQSEAGYAVGLRKAGVMRLILLPQAIRAMLPVIIAQLVVTLKDTALGFIITYPELLYFARLLGSNGEYGSPLIQAALVASVIYVAMCLLLSYLAHRVEIGLRRSPKASKVAGAEPAGQTGTDTELIVAQRGFGKNDPGSAS